jgi:Flp pilus assembly pilin Flp
MPHVVAVRSGASAIRAMLIALIATALILGTVAFVAWVWPESGGDTVTTRETPAQIQSSTAAEHDLLTGSGGNIQSSTAVEHDLLAGAGGNIQSSTAVEHDLQTRP